MTEQFMIDNPEKSEAYSFLSDMYKDAYGIRPRGVYNVEAMSLEDIQAEIDVCHEVVYDNMEREAIEEANAEWLFQALVDKTIKLGASDEKTALKWLFEATLDNPSEVSYFDVEGFLYQNGIMHTEYGKKVQKILL